MQGQESKNYMLQQDKKVTDGGETNEGVRVVRMVAVRLDGPTVVASSQACVR